MTDNILLEIARKAIDVENLTIQRRHDLDALRQAYREAAWNRGFRGFIDKKSPEWAELRADAQEFHYLLDATKREERNARKRLSRAIEKWRGKSPASQKATVA